MNIKKIIVFVLLLLLIYSGIYIAVYGTKQYLLYSGAERDFNYMKPGELQSELNIRGNIGSVKAMILEVPVTNNILGIPIGKKSKRQYYALQLGNTNEKKYCVISVNEPKDIEAVKKLTESDAAPRFEFRGIVMDMSLGIHGELSNYLRGEYDDLNVNKYIVPYTIFVKSDKEDDLLLPIIAGGAVTLVSTGAFVILAVRTYKRKHMYD